MKTLIGLLCGCVLASVYAASQLNHGVRPRLSAHALVVDLVGTPGVPKTAQDPNVMYAQRYAEGYVAGVADASQGKTWCAPGQLKEDEIDDRAFAELKRMPVDALQGSAATLFIEQLNKKFPCQP